MERIRLHDSREADFLGRRNVPDEETGDSPRDDARRNADVATYVTVDADGNAWTMPRDINAVRVTRARRGVFIRDGEIVREIDHGTVETHGALRDAVLPMLDRTGGRR